MSTDGRDDVQPDDNPESTDSVDIPEDALIVSQSNWAWMAATIPWLGFFGGAIFFDLLTFGVLPVILAAIVIVPRYLVFRGTAYYLTDNHLIVQQGALMGRRRVALPLRDMNTVTIDPGMFGRALGYTGINVLFRDNRMAPLRYVPLASPLVAYFQSHVNPDSPIDAPSDDAD